MIRRTSLPDHEVPLHYEGISLKTWTLVVGWPLGLVSAVGGVVLAGKASGFAVELIGVIAAALEIVLGARLLTVGAGPLLRRVPVGLIDRVEERAATSWRRLYSDRELAANLTVGDRVLVFPSDEPQEVASAIRGVRSH
jgi:hypothetical protein